VTAIPVVILLVGFQLALEITLAPKGKSGLGPDLLSVLRIRHTQAHEVVVLENRVRNERFVWLARDLYAELLVKSFGGGARFFGKNQRQIPHRQIPKAYVAHKCKTVSEIEVAVRKHVSLKARGDG